MDNFTYRMILLVFTWAGCVLIDRCVWEIFHPHERWKARYAIIFCGFATFLGALLIYAIDPKFFTLHP